MSRAESETYAAYIIQEHTVIREVALKHEITSGLASHKPRKASGKLQVLLLKTVGGGGQQICPKICFNYHKMTRSNLTNIAINMRQHVKHQTANVDCLPLPVMSLTRGCNIRMSKYYI